jgi:hypothetical protein
MGKKALAHVKRGAVEHGAGGCRGPCR